MRDSGDHDEQSVAIDAVDEPVIACSDPPQVLAARQFPGSWWLRLTSEQERGLEQARLYRSVQPHELLPGSTGELNPEAALTHPG